MDWDINMRNSTTQSHPVGLRHQHGELIHSKRRYTQHYHGKPNRMDWDINTVEKTPLDDTDRKRPSRRGQPLIYTCSCHEDTGPRRKGEEGSRRHRTEQPPPCGKPVAVAPLQSHTPSDRVESPNPDLTPAASQSPPRKHNVRGPRHTRR